MNILQESGETQVKTLIDDVQDYQTEGQCAECTSVTSIINVLFRQH